MRITSSGAVLIGGTQNDYGKLDVTVSPSSYTAALGLGLKTNSGEGNSVGISFKTKIYLSANIWENARIAAFTDAINSSAYGALAFYTMSATNLLERMRIGNNGFVGIGTSSPGQLLTVQGLSGTINIEDNTVYAEGVGGKLSLSGNYRTVGDITEAGYIKASKVNATNADYGFNMIFATSNYPNGLAERMRITSGGVVQIAGLTSNGTVSTQNSNGSLYVSSDANLKIEDGFVENGIEKVLALKPRYFYWKDKELFSADRQLGFYAQEVNEVSEETANTPPMGCGWGIYDRGLIAILTKAIQEQQSQIDILKQEIINLKTN
jgi:hypothetical protein